MSTEENKAIVRRDWEETWNKGNLDTVDEIFATTYVGHFLSPEFPPDLEGYKQFINSYRTAFPDIHITIEDEIAEGDKVVTRFTSRGTHKGELMGIAPTGEQVTVTGISIFRIAGGKIVEDWTEFDAVGMLQQLGVMPPSEEAGG